MDLVKQNRMMSLLGQRGTFGMYLTELASEKDSIIAVTSDLTRTSGLESFSKKYSERFYNVGIAEQNAIGFAAGLADCGKIPFVTTFSNFAVLRASEFVRHFLAYMKCNVKLVGFGSGFAMELFGNTHYALEDIAVLRSMPNITILSPSDCMEVARCTEKALEMNGPVYIRLSGKMNNPIIHKDNYLFEVGKAEKLTEGRDAVVYATGSMVNVAVKAYKLLEKEGIYVTIVNEHTIKPFDKQSVINNKDIKLHITIEEHSIVGGLGSCVAETLAENSIQGELIRLGTSDEYYKAGSYEYMLERHGLTVDNLISIIKNKI